MLIFLIISTLLILLSIGLLISHKNSIHGNLSFSIIIPCRNEAQNLATLFASLEALDYPQELFEIILVDDASSDNTGILISEFCKNKANCHMVSISDKSYDFKGKKNALKRGIDKAQYQNLLFTDADCVVPEEWLASYNPFIDKETGMVVGYSPEVNVTSFRRFTQILTADFYCATINLGFPFSNNGRNLYINKKAYDEVGGFEKIKNFTCGEDKLLLNLIKRTDFKITYNPRSKVITNPLVYDHANQQKRRYGQFSLSSPLYKVLSIMVFLFYLYIPVHLIFFREWLTPSIYYVSFLIFWICGLYVHREKLHLFDVVYILIYPYYLIYYSLLGMFSKWTWK